MSATSNSDSTASRSLLRLGQFRLDHAPSLFQGFHLPLRRGDDLKSILRTRPGNSDADHAPHLRQFGCRLLATPEFESAQMGASSKKSKSWALRRRFSPTREASQASLLPELGTRVTRMKSRVDVSAPQFLVWRDGDSRIRRGNPSYCLPNSTTTRVRSPVPWVYQPSSWCNAMSYVASCST